MSSRRAISLPAFEFLMRLFDYYNRGIDQFTELRWITIETQPGHFPI